MHQREAPLFQLRGTVPARLRARGRIVAPAKFLIGNFSTGHCALIVASQHAAEAGATLANACPYSDVATCATEVKGEKRKPYESKSLGHLRDSHWPIIRNHHRPIYRPLVWVGIVKGETPHAHTKAADALAR